MSRPIALKQWVFRCRATYVLPGRLFVLDVTSRLRPFPIPATYRDAAECDVGVAEPSPRPKKSGATIRAFQADAADVLAGADQINASRGNHPNISPSASYRIVARCVER
jgi:hypothetical protein